LASEASVAGVWSGYGSFGAGIYDSHWDIKITPQKSSIKREYQNKNEKGN
jgi:hypothetical protein